MDTQTRRDCFKHWYGITNEERQREAAKGNQERESHNRGVHNLEALGKRLKNSALQYVFQAWVDYKARNAMHAYMCP